MDTPIPHSLQLAVASIFTHPRVCQTISRMDPPELRDDLRQEVFLDLMGKDPARLLDMHSRGELVFYVIRMITMIAKSKRSKFYYQYRKNRFISYDEFPSLLRD